MIFAAFAASPTSAAASERILDGSFETVTACTGDIGGDCTSPVWAESLSAGGGTGPLCKAGIGSCGFFEGPGNVFSHGGAVWGQLGGETLTDPQVTYSVQQVVNIPAPPATLSFQLMRRDSNASTGAFTVAVDGTPVYAAGGADSAYAPVSVDISPFAGGLRTLRFQAIDTQDRSMVSSDSFNVDDVSLDAPDTAAAPPSAPAIAVAKKCGKRKKLRKGRCVRKHGRHKR